MTGVQRWPGGSASGEVAVSALQECSTRKDSIRRSAWDGSFLEARPSLDTRMLCDSCRGILGGTLQGRLKLPRRTEPAGCGPGWPSP